MKVGNLSKTVEDELRDQTELLVNAQRIGRMGSWSFDIETGVLVWSAATCELFGILPSEFRGTFEHFYSFILAEDRAGYDASHARVTPAEPSLVAEYRIRRPDGTVRSLSERGNVSFNETGEAVSRLGMVMDVTEQREASEQLEQSAALLRIAGRAARLGGWSIELPDRKLTWSDENCAIHEVPAGYQPTLEEGLSYYAPEDRAEVMRHVQLCEQFGTPYDFELPKKTAKGRRIWVRSIGQAVRDIDGKIIGLQGAFQDITDRRRAEEALRENENQLRIIFENSALGIGLVGGDSCLIKSNATLQQMLGYTFEELNGMPVCEFTHPDDIEADIHLFQEVCDGTRDGYRIEKRYITKGGKMIWVNLNLSAVRNSSGELQYAIGLVEDITPRKVAEDALRRSSEYLALAHEVAKIGSFELDLKTNRGAASDVLGTFYGEASRMEGDHYDDWVKRVHPEDMPKITEYFEQAISTGVLNSEYRIVHDDGSIRWLWAKGKVIYDDKNTPTHLVGVNMDVTETKLAGDTLRASEERYRDLIENAHDIIFTLDLGGTFTSVNKACEQITGFTPEECLALTLEKTVAPEYVETARQMIDRKLAGEHTTAFGIEIVAKDGHRVSIEVNSRIIRKDGVPVGIQGIARDVTDRRKLEEQLRQSQKLESVGLLAGGIAHDFNNMLTAINGHSELTLRRMAADDPLRRNIEEIKKAGEHSAALTDQLLAFSRQQIVQPKILALSRVIGETSAMLERLIGEDVQLITVLNPKVGKVNIDPSQLSQILMNLALNSRDAMPKGGKLTLETKNVFLDDEYARQHLGLLPGAYVMLSVSDNGIGMDAVTQRHMFEPFFTTKEVGKGTGLGLATVYGIVKQSGGGIAVYSEETIGTTFKVYLPRVPDTLEENIAAETESDFSKGSETILLVEDEEIVRSLTRQILEMCGYKVLEAGNGREALALCGGRDCSIDLLMTDVVMPEMGGRELSEEFAKLYTGTRVLFTSGYTDDAIVRHGVIEAHTNFIQKPFSADALADKVRSILDGPSPQ